MTKRWVWLGLVLLLAGCIETSAPANTSPEMAGLVAGATQTAVFQHQSSTATAIEATRQAVAYQATLDAIQHATATSQAAQATATISAAYAYAEVSATGTAVFILTQRELANSTATAQAADRAATATATAEVVRWNKARDMDTFWRWFRWSLLGLFVLGGLVIIYGLKRHFEYSTSDPPEIINGNGDVVALPGNYRFISRTPQLAPPAPSPPAPSPPVNNMMKLNGELQEKRRREMTLSYDGMSFTFTGRNLNRLHKWFLDGHKTIRRDPSPNGPSFSELPDPIRSDNYTVALAVLKGRGLVMDGTNQWTEKGEWVLAHVGLPHPNRKNGKTVVVSRDDDDDDGQTATVNPNNGGIAWTA